MKDSNGVMSVILKKRKLKNISNKKIFNFVFFLLKKNFAINQRKIHVKTFQKCIHENLNSKKVLTHELSGEVGVVPSSHEISAFYRLPSSRHLFVSNPLIQLREVVVVGGGG